MKIFVAASYSSQVNYETGHVFAPYKQWLEGLLGQLEAVGFEVICSLRSDNYRINDGDPAGAFRLDTESIANSDALLALLDDHVSAGVQTEIGYALALHKRVILAHAPEDTLAYINNAVVKAGQASEVLLPLTKEGLAIFS